MRINSILGHGAKAVLKGALLTLLVGSLFAGTTLAAPGGKGGGGGGGGNTAGGTLKLVVLDGATEAHQGSRITFTVSTTATDRPFIIVKCWQGSTGVYNNIVGIFPTYMYDPWLTLDSSYWTAGISANCTATGFYYDRKGNQVTFATLNFTVLP
jgi:hypothetical protein